jgi:hypothetical protein
MKKFLDTLGLKNLKIQFSGKSHNNSHNVVNNFFVGPITIGKFSPRIKDKNQKYIEV